MRTRKRVAIVQSNYIPWKGYFDLIAMSDEFILFDDVQYTRRDWRNRNRIKTKDGLIWLSIPVHSKGSFTARVSDMVVSDPEWPAKHWRTISQSYARAAGFGRYGDWLEDLYIGTTEIRLSRINYRFLEAFCQQLGIGTPIRWSSDFPAAGRKSERLLDLCLQLGATEYVSGPAARSYLDEGLFESHGITVEYVDYSGYREYPQVFTPFEHHVSIVDLLLNVGESARSYLKTP